MEEFSPEHYNVLMSFKEWASALYGSVGNAFKNFDKEGDGILTLSILRRACQKGKWSGDAQMLFDSVRPSSCKDPNQITVEDVSFLDLWPDREDGEDPAEDVAVLDGDSEAEDSDSKGKAATEKTPKTPKVAPSVFERLYQVPMRRCNTAPALVETSGIARVLEPETTEQMITNAQVCSICCLLFVKRD